MPVISGKNLPVPCWRIPAGIFISINVNSWRRWKSAINHRMPPALSVEIRASYELGRMLGGGEVIGEFQMSWGSYSIMEMSHSIYPSHTRVCVPSHMLAVISTWTTWSYHSCPASITKANLATLMKAISLYEEALCLCPVGHESRDYSLDSLGSACFTCFFKRGNTDTLTRAISLYREVLTLRPPGHPCRGITLYHLALALHKRYEKLHVNEDLNEAIDRYRESLWLRRLDHPERHVTLFNLSSVLCSRFTQTQEKEDVEEAITLCQESLTALSSLHPDRYFCYMGLQEAYLSRYQILHDHADLSLAMEDFRLASRHPTQGFREQPRTGSPQQSSTTQHHVPSAATIYDRQWNSWSTAVASNGHWHLGSGHQLKISKLSKRVSNSTQSSAAITDRAATDRAATVYRRLTEQWAAAVAEIRDLRTFSRFLLPPLYEDLQAAAR
ncbi:hypothetical protein F4604DRAFT_1681024 [Suillus subluteus]|nr:hypothetical protein F4604DRAFT_1681024 [Suillus subluteus]